MCRAAPISALDRPPATAARTSISRAVSELYHAGLAVAGGVSTNAAMSRRTSDGASTDSPWATWCTAASRSAGCVLEQEPACACPQGGMDVLVQVERGQHDHPGLR